MGAFRNIGRARASHTYRETCRCGDCDRLRREFDVADRAVPTPVAGKAPPAAGFDLSQDQEAARQAVLASIASGALETVLTGPAGSGKTTLMRVLLADLEHAHRSVRLTAPTGKAAARLRELTGRSTSTVHAPLYKAVSEQADGTLDFHDPQALVANKHGVVVVDEASMLGMSAYLDLRKQLPEGAQILCIGDREQLLPVGEPQGPNFVSPTATLTEIHRQAAGSPIIRLATAIREGKPWRSVTPDGEVYRRHDQAQLADAVAWLLAHRQAGRDATLLTFANATRRMLNDAVREALGRGDDYLDVGDRIVCIANNKKLRLMNGEVREVAGLRPWGAGMTAEVLLCGDGVPVLMIVDTLAGCENDHWRELAETFDKPDAARLVRAEYGECLTTHKAQGSQWDHVGVYHDSTLRWYARKDADSYRRLMYTAVTRAAKELAIFEA